MSNLKNNSLTPGYIESTNSSRRISKEDVRLDQIMPENILSNNPMFEELMKAYYEFMNLEEYIYTSDEKFTTTILDNKATFRISDPENSNDEFFYGIDSNLIPKRWVYDFGGRLQVGNTPVLLTDPRTTSFELRGVFIPESRDDAGSGEQLFAYIRKYAQIRIRPNEDYLELYNHGDENPTATLLTSLIVNRNEENSFSFAWDHLTNTSTVILNGESVQTVWGNISGTEPLSGIRISTVYSGSDPCYCSFRDFKFYENFGLKHHWPMDENSGNEFYDVEGDKNITVSDWPNPGPPAVGWIKVIDTEADHKPLLSIYDGTELVATASPTAGDFQLKTDNVSVTRKYDNSPPGYSNAELGKTFSVHGLSNSYNGLKAVLHSDIINITKPNPSHVMSTIDQVADIDVNSEEYLTYLQKEIAPIIPRKLDVDLRTFLKRVADFYNIRGTEDSIKAFFKIFFNEDVDIKYPWNETLIPSSGDWSTDTNNYSNTKGQLSSDIKLQDLDYYQKHSYVIKSGVLQEDWEFPFKRLAHPAGMKYFGEVTFLIQAIEALSGNIKNSRRPDWQYRSGLRHEYLGSKMPKITPGYVGRFALAILISLVENSNSAIEMSNKYGKERLAVIITGLRELLMYAVDSQNYYNRKHITAPNDPPLRALGFNRTVGSFGTATIENVISDVKPTEVAEVVTSLYTSSAPVDLPDSVDLLTESGDEILITIGGQDFNIEI